MRHPGCSTCQSDSAISSPPVRLPGEPGSRPRVPSRRIPAQHLRDGTRRPKLLWFCASASGMRANRRHPTTGKARISMPPDAAVQALHVDPIPEAPFYIAVADAATRARRALKSGDTFIVMDSHGDVGASAGGPDGLFHCDTRHLSRLELTVNELQPLLLGSNLRDDNALLGDRSDQSGYFLRPAHRAAEGHAAHRAYGLPVARNRLSATGGAQLRRPRRGLAAGAPVRLRFCRSVRGARIASRPPRRRDPQGRRPRSSLVELSRARRQDAAHQAHV